VKFVSLRYEAAITENYLYSLWLNSFSVNSVDNSGDTESYDTCFRPPWKSLKTAE